LRFGNLVAASIAAQGAIALAYCAALAYANQEDTMLRPIGLIILAGLAVAPLPARALANPAAVFCVESGGKSEIRNGAKGQYGVCRLPSGRVVDEWAYFRANKGKVRRAQ
jgi:uncharacterized protein